MFSYFATVSRVVVGRLFFIHNSIFATILCISNRIWTGKPGKPEYLLCGINIVGHPPCFAAVVHRPPHAPFIQGTDFIDKITKLMHDYSTKIIVGDSNADQICSSAEATFVCRFIDDNGLYMVKGTSNLSPSKLRLMNENIVAKQNEQTTLTHHNG